LQVAVGGRRRERCRYVHGGAVGRRREAEGVDMMEGCGGNGRKRKMRVELSRAEDGGEEEWQNEEW
jgi:hypothetical protein